MTTIDRNTVKTVQSDINEALASVATKHGLKSLKCAGGSFNPEAGNFVIKVEGIAEDGIDKSAAIYKQTQAFMHGLPPLCHAFTSGGQQYSTVGMNSTGSKVIAQRKDGKRFLFKTDDLIAICARQGYKPEEPTSGLTMVNLADVLGPAKR